MLSVAKCDCRIVGVAVDDWSIDQLVERARTSIVATEELRQYIDESQLLRITHYLGKMGLEVILYLRFGNTMLEPVWNRNSSRVCRSRWPKSSVSTTAATSTGTAVFRAVVTADPTHYVRGQYDGYRSIDGVAADSTPRRTRR